MNIHDNSEQSGSKQACACHIWRDKRRVLGICDEPGRTLPKTQFTHSMHAQAQAQLTRLPSASMTGPSCFQMVSCKLRAWGKWLRRAMPARLARNGTASCGDTSASCRSRYTAPSEASQACLGLHGPEQMVSSDICDECVSRMYPFTRCVHDVLHEMECNGGQQRHLLPPRPA